MDKSERDNPTRKRPLLRGPLGATLGAFGFIIYGIGIWICTIIFPNDAGLPVYFWTWIFVLSLAITAGIIYGTQDKEYWG